MVGLGTLGSTSRRGARRADVIVVPSDDRHATLKEKLQLDVGKPFVTIRNTPDLTLPLLDIDWRTRLGIPRGKKIFIHAGSTADWAQVPEILTSVSYWPTDAVFLLHNSRSQDIRAVQGELSHLDNPARVFWNYDLILCVVAPAPAGPPAKGGISEVPPTTRPSSLKPIGAPRTIAADGPESARLESPRLIFRFAYDCVLSCDRFLMAEDSP